MSEGESVSLRERQSAFKRRISTYALQNNDHYELNDFFRDAFPIFETETKKLLNKFLILKLNTCLEAKFIKPTKEDNDSDGGWEYTTFYIQTPNKVLDGSKNILQFYKKKHNNENNCTDQ